MSDVCGFDSPGFRVFLFFLVHFILSSLDDTLMTFLIPFFFPTDSSSEDPELTRPAVMELDHGAVWSWVVHRRSSRLVDVSCDTDKRGICATWAPTIASPPENLPASKATVFPFLFLILNCVRYLSTSSSRKQIPTRSQSYNLNPHLYCIRSKSRDPPFESQKRRTGVIAKICQPGSLLPLLLLLNLALGGGECG
ncbi:hypothetical protein GALMADRAFT_412904 [Galerina marginata CBS 339.88]|uniref:Uncharacterized protein n=1 Tax=Galerina marginata (strain CBS 339.88) TaxID=685588 RepID=A0A067T5Y7_GALM3|nr:hypothetical protein GALMADRAFT_412904 [Galerina marginata CBS 339.88]